MRIAEISTLARPVPPQAEGSVESLVHAITEGLVRRGHDVTLFATADSKTSARLVSPVERSYMADVSKWDWQLYEAHQVSEVFRRADEFDVIHCHSYHFGLLFCDFVRTPSLHSFHIEPGPDYRFLAERTRNRHLQFCSQWQAREFDGMKGIHVIPHGIDLAQFPFHAEGARENYFAFLGRMIPEKGILEAIDLAERTGIPLKIAAPANDYYEQNVRHRIDGKAIEYLGELGPSERAEFLGKARALIYPVQRAEPFGLVLVEAMACGTPVLALNQGAVPEIVRDGETGWICNNLEELVNKADRIDHLDRKQIRKYVEQNFSSEIMIDRLESLMREIVEGKAS